MSSAGKPQSIEEITDVLGRFRRKGVTLWAENGQLRYRVPKGVLTPEDIERLRACRGQILSFLECARRAEHVRQSPAIGRRAGAAPLGYSQLAHWHLYRLDERRSLRQIASATRLCGRLNVSALGRSIMELVRRHDALRTRILRGADAPVQTIVEPGDWRLELVDMTALPDASLPAGLDAHIEQFILEPIDVFRDSLFGMRLLRLREDEHVLIAAMEHMISDAISMSLLLRDLFTAYARASGAEVPAPPEIAVQYIDYCARLREAERSWIERHGPYWKERLSGIGRVRFPEDRRAGASRGWDAVPIVIGKALEARLREWCRQRRTTLVMSVFTVYAALVMRWCGVSETIILYQTDGRASPEVENTIGFFASVLHLRMTLHDGDRLIDLLERAVAEYCAAYEHADFSYLESLCPRPQYARNAAFNWVPQGPAVDLSDACGPGERLTCHPVEFEHPMLKTLDRDNEPMALFYDIGDEIHGGVYFPMSRFSRELMERFARGFMELLTTLLAHPERRVKDIHVRD